MIWPGCRKSAAAANSAAAGARGGLLPAGVVWQGVNKPNGAKRSEPFLRGRWIQALYALIDACCVLASGVIAYLLRFHSKTIIELLRTGHYFSIAPHYGGFLLLDVCLTLLFCQEQHLYRTQRERLAIDESLAVVRAVVFANILLTAFVYLAGASIVSRLVVVTSAVLNILALSTWRYAKRRIVLHRAERGIGARHALIIGAGKVGHALAAELESNKLLGYRVVGFLDVKHFNDSRRLGDIEDLRRVVRSEYVDEIFVTIPSERELVKNLVHEAQTQRLSIHVIPELYDGLGWTAPFRRLGGFPVMDLHWHSIPSLGLFFKRTIDVVFSALALILFMPLFIVIAICIPLDSAGPVLYTSIRVGKKGRPFRFIKFRTMAVNADHIKDSLRKHNERTGPCFKLVNDPRVTRLGRFLRKYSLDELPQLWNVLVGDMSLVGPRPHPLDDYKQYDVDHRRRLEIKPGITGLWQVTARQDPSFELTMRLDLQYIEKWCLKLDFEIIFRTFGAVVRGEGC